MSKENKGRKEVTVTSEHECPRCGYRIHAVMHYMDTTTKHCPHCVPMERMLCVFIDSVTKTKE
jgi:hypothetical protein